MSCMDRGECSSCIFDVLEKILILQKQNFDCESYVGCDKPFLGPIINRICYNTRPIQLYNCCSGTPWSFTYTLDGTTATSDIFRVESLDDCCCTCRILAPGTEVDTYVNTNQFFTVDLKCCGAIRCLPDTSVDLC